MIDEMHSLFNKDAEQRVLGGILIDPRKIEDVTEEIGETDFYSPAHMAIFRHMLALTGKMVVIDVITLADSLSSSNELESACGGMGYLVELQQNTTSAANIVAYARAVKTKSTERGLLLAAKEITDIVHSNLDIDDKVVQSQGAVLALESSNGEDVAIADCALKSVVEAIDERFNSDGGMLGIETSYTDIDNRLQGLRGGDVLVLAGRPAMGKTTLAMNIGEHVACNLRKCVLVFSLEMSKEQLMERMTASAGKIPFARIRSGNMQEEDWPKLAAGVGKLKGAPLYIDDRAALSVNQMRSTARKLDRRADVQLIIVDYLQLATAKADGRVNEVTKISQGMKALAKDLDVPVIAISQLNRDCEKGPNKRPNNSHLRDSGAIEQDADLIAFVYRDEVYNEDSPHKGITEVIWGKFRNGEIGTDYLASRLDICRFDNLTREVPEITQKKPKSWKY